MKLRGSLRFRLTLWFLAIFLGIEVALSATWMLFRYDNAKRSLDNQLTARGEEKAKLLAEASALWDEQQISAVAESIYQLVPCDTCAIRLRTGHADTVAGARVGLRVDFPETAAYEGPESRLDWLHVDVGRGPDKRRAEARVLTRPVLVAGNRLMLDILIVPRLASASLAFALDFLLIALPIGLIAAGIAAWLLNGRVTAPLAEMAQAAETISPRHLDRRLDVDPAGDELASLQDRLNDALERLETGYRAQERFIANVSHELKTPVAVLLTEAQVLAAGDSDLEEHIAFRRSVEQELQHLGKLVESFLTLTRSDHGKALARSECVAANDIALDAVRRLEPVAEQHGAHFALDLSSDLPEVEGDPELLQNLLENLMRNAIKFSPDSRIAVTVAAEGDAVLLSVRDSGPGIPEEDLDRIFDRYYQSGGNARRRGTGLGLAIASSVARLHGGEITARNNPERGCTLCVRLPRLVRGAAGT